MFYKLKKDRFNKYLPQIDPYICSGTDRKFLHEPWSSSSIVVTAVVATKRTEWLGAAHFYEKLSDLLGNILLILLFCH